MDVLATAVVWISVGIALVLLIQEQSKRLADFSKAQADSRAQVAQDILDVCRDQACVALYEQLTPRIPDNLVYYALAETRQRVARGEASEGPAALFTETISRIASERGFTLELSAAA